MPQKPLKKLKTSELMEMTFHSALPGSKELGELTKSFYKGVGQAAKDIARDPLGWAVSAFNPLEGIKGAATASDTAIKDPTLPNIAMALGTGMTAMPTLGSVGYTLGKSGVPVMRDPVSGVQFSPTSPTYFGRDMAEQAEHLAKIRRILESNAVNPSHFIDNVPTNFGIDIPSPTGRVTRSTLALPISSEQLPPDAKAFIGNMLEATHRIPTEKPWRVFLDESLYDKYNAVGLAEVGVPNPYARVLPSIDYSHSALPHELQHLDDFERRQPLFSVDANYWATHNIGGATPTSAMNNFIFESRAELSAERFKNWLRTNGIMHWWDEPGAWPR